MSDASTARKGVNCRCVYRRDAAAGGRVYTDREAVVRRGGSSLKALRCLKPSTLTRSRSRYCLAFALSRGLPPELKESCVGLRRMWHILGLTLGLCLG